jgi:hypothetical protein
MRTLYSLVAVVLVAAVLAGCPRPLQRDYTFTSAVTGQRGGLFDDLAGAPTAPDSEGEGDPTRAVVEPDVIRRVGNHLFILNQHRGLMVVDLDTNALLGVAPTYGYPRDLYLVGDRAYVLVGYAGGISVAEDAVQWSLGSRVYVLDIADPAAPKVLSQFELDGDFVDSRLVGDVLYAVSAEYQWTYEGGPGDVVTSPGVSKAQTSASWVNSLALGDPEAIQIVDTVSLEGFGNLIHTTPDALFVVASDWQSDTSAITYVDISDAAGAITVRGAASVRGQVQDRFKLDAYQGVLRVVSATNWPNREVLVSTITLANPDALALLGETSVEGAAGETLFATRFDGPRGYIVTYLVVDPLFVIDFSDPVKPVVAGMLEVPGWSTHIEPMGDRLMALGVDDTGGQRRVSVSLFDVADPAAPGLLDRVSFGEGWSWSSAYEDVKAFTVFDDLVLVPFSGWTGEGGFERLQLVSYTRDSLTANGYVDLQGQMKRALAYEDAHFAVTSEQLAALDTSDRDNPVVTDRLTLAENVTDYVPLASGDGAMVVQRWDTGDVLIRTVDAAGTPLGQATLAANNLTDVFPYGDTVVLVSTGWADRGFYEVTLVDCADPAAPAAGAPIRVDIEPYWGGWWWGGPPVDVAMGDSAMWRPYYLAQGAAHLAGKFLVLRGQAQEYDAVLGEGDAAEGIALVDLDTGVWTRTLGLAVPGIESLHAANGVLYLSNREQSGVDLAFRPVAAYYVRAFNPAAETLGAAANVPGRFLQYDPATRVLSLEDYQYVRNFEVERSVATVRWDGEDGVEPLDTAALPGYTGTLLPRGSRIVFEQWDTAMEVTSLTVGADGELAAGASVAVNGAWASLIDARGDVAYVNIAGGAVAQYDLGDASLVRADAVMSSPWRIRFGDEAAFAPLGYSGVLRMPYPAR